MKLGLKRVSLLSIFWAVASFAQPTLSLEEKVGQLLMVHFRGESGNSDAQLLIEELGVGGIIYYQWSNGLHSLAQIKALSEELQDFAKIPLLIGIDQEGGRINRLPVSFPSNRIVGDLDNPETAERVAFEMGSCLHEVGININFAPVVDVDSNPLNPIIGDRSFSPTPEKVSEFGEYALKGYRKASIFSTLKHFPGHGDTLLDSHENLPLIRKSLDELLKVELLPFARLASMADLVMTAHLLVPALDEENCSTLSKKTLDYLRQELSFSGAIISDSLNMRGVLLDRKIEDVAILALQAGCDLLLLGGGFLEKGDFIEQTPADVARIHAAIVSAVKDGTLSQKRVEEALTRVLRLKASLR